MKHLSNAKIIDSFELDVLVGHGMCALNVDDEDNIVAYGDWYISGTVYVCLDKRHRVLDISETDPWIDSVDFMFDPEFIELYGRFYELSA